MSASILIYLTRPHMFRMAAVVYVRVDDADIRFDNFGG